MRLEIIAINNSTGDIEVIDYCGNYDSAIYLRKEYSLAYGKKFTIDIRKNVNYSEENSSDICEKEDSYSSIDSWFI